jgi:hypothetical protein
MLSIFQKKLKHFLFCGIPVHIVISSTLVNVETKHDSVIHNYIHRTPFFSSQYMTYSIYVYRDNMRMYVGVLYSWQGCAGQIGGKWGLLLTGSFVGAANDRKSGPNVAYLPTSP